MRKVKQGRVMYSTGLRGMFAWSRCGRGLGVVRPYTALRRTSAACARGRPLSAEGMGWSKERVNREALQNVEELS